MSEIYYRNKNEKGKIDKNLVNANIKLVDENKYIKEQIKRIIEYMEDHLGNIINDEFRAFGDLDYAQDEVEEIYKMLKGLVE